MMMASESGARKESRLTLNSTRRDAERIANLLIIKTPTRKELLELAALLRDHVRGMGTDL